MIIIVLFVILIIIYYTKIPQTLFHLFGETYKIFNII